LRTFALRAFACGMVIQKGELWPDITVRMVSRKLLIPWYASPLCLRGRELPPAVQGLRHGRTPRSMIRMISLVMTSEASNLDVRDRAMVGVLSCVGEKIGGQVD